MTYGMGELLYVDADRSSGALAVFLLEVGLVSSRRERDGNFRPGFTSRPETLHPGNPGILTTLHF